MSVEPILMPDVDVANEWTMELMRSKSDCSTTGQREELTKVLVLMHKCMMYKLRMVNEHIVMLETEKENLMKVSVCII